MADNTAKYGFRLFRGLFSDTGSTMISRQIVASNYDSTTGVGTAGVSLRAGEVVNLLADGSVKHCGAGTNATAANQPLGVIVGIEPWFDTTIGQTGAMRRTDNLPTGVVYGTNLERQSAVLIVPAEGNVFEVDVNDNTTATTLAAYQAFIGENANMGYAAVAPKAFPKLNISGHAATATLQWRIVGVSPTVENFDFSGANVKLLVTPVVVQDAPFTPLGI